MKWVYELNKLLVLTNHFPLFEKVNKGTAFWNLRTNQSISLSNELGILEINPNILYSESDKFWNKRFWLVWRFIQNMERANIIKSSECLFDVFNGSTIRQYWLLVWWRESGLLNEEGSLINRRWCGDKYISRGLVRRSSIKRRNFHHKLTS